MPHTSSPCVQHTWPQLEKNTLPPTLSIFPPWILVGGLVLTLVLPPNVTLYLSIEMHAAI